MLLSIYLISIALLWVSAIHHIFIVKEEVLVSDLAIIIGASLVPVLNTAMILYTLWHRIPKTATINRKG